MDRAAIDLLIDTVLDALARAPSISPASLLFLVRQYVDTGRGDVANALGLGLEQALSICRSPTEQHRRPAWIEVLTESAGCSDDGRLPDAVVWLSADLSRQWPSHGRVGTAAPSIEACLAAVLLHPDTGRAQELLKAAIDELERIIDVVYLPGQGIGRDISETSADGELLDYLTLASALLTAFGATGRLPYSMLAEELMQSARRRWWSAQDGRFLENVEPFRVNCAAARVLCRLAALHHENDYREAAVIASGADYSLDAGTILGTLGSTSMPAVDEAAAYGVALGEWLGLG